VVGTAKTPKTSRTIPPMWVLRVLVVDGWAFLETVPILFILPAQNRQAVLEQKQRKILILLNGGIDSACCA